MGTAEGERVREGGGAKNRMTVRRQWMLREIRKKAGRVEQNNT